MLNKLRLDQTKNYEKAIAANEIAQMLASCNTLRSIKIRSLWVYMRSPLVAFRALVATRWSEPLRLDTLS